ncbi:MAG: 8-oxoguanine glycosylase domain protein [Pedosphaera sp.]|nr:8-oxoguanine glycosylase domain protein [Pedosphaera sp.]
MKFPVRDYDLASTLACGQAFRWQQQQASWTGVIGNRWVRLRSTQNCILAETGEPAEHWDWLTDYLQIEMDLEVVLASFPDDEPMRSAVCACRGLRLLRQEPWECLASFILSSTKQIVQIRQIIALLCERYGESLAVPAGEAAAHGFPSPARLAALNEAELRSCKMGFRAPYLLATAQAIAQNQFDLERLRGMPVAEARIELISLPGVGRKIADCVLLFAYGFQAAFPVDVWVMKALCELYFPRRRPTLPRLQHFTETYFGDNAGYAQQYLFHYMRTRRPVKSNE